MMNVPGKTGRSLPSLWIVLVALTASAAVANAIDSAAVNKLFVDPPREFSSAPLWVWNDMLTEQQIVETMRDLAAQKVRQVFVHPRPGLMTPYLSADWFRLWKAALAEAERLDMNVWIYDENSYPSGFAGGLVPEAMPESRGRGLSLRTVQKGPKAEPGLLAAFRLGGEAPEDVTAQVRGGTALPDGHSYLVATVQRAADSAWTAGRSYVDLLYPGVTEKFLDITLGAYQREIGAHFGQRVPGMFTDEPNIIPAGGLPWTDDLPEQFQKRWGYDLMQQLPSLHLELGDWRRVRHNYFSLLNELFIERWAKPYAARCEKAGLEMTGHYWEHEWPNCKGVPDNMALYAWQQRPGIDCLMNQYAEHTHAQFGNVRSVRELGSIANQLGKKRTLCEVYGAGGWDLRFEDMKRQADWLGVLGVNTFDQHLSYVTIRGARKRDHPQSFSYHEPWWEAYHVEGAYLERLSVAMSQGEQINHILVLEPTTTAWMYQGSDARLKPLGDAFFDLLIALESAQVEYDLGDEDVMARHGSVEGKRLAIGKRQYHTVVLPPLLENLDGQTWQLLNDFITAGGVVLACKPMGAQILRTDGAFVANDAALARWNARWQTVDPKALPSMLRNQEQGNGLVINRADGDAGILFHMRRRLDDGELLFLVNTSNTNASRGAIVTGLPCIQLWDLETGKTRAYPFRHNSGMSGAAADFELPPSGSLLLWLSRNTAAPQPVVQEAKYFAGGITQQSARRLEPNILVLDYVDITAGGESRTNIYVYQANQFAFQKNGLQRNPWDSAVQFKDELIRRRFPADSGFKASYRFTVEQKVPPGLWLVLERADLYTISCNGRVVQPIPGAWWLDKAFAKIDLREVARVGENEVTITAAPFTVYHELEAAYLLGDFRLKPVASGFVIVPDQQMQLGHWRDQGYPFYAHGVSYEQQFNLGDVPTGDFKVALPSWRGSVAKVRVNGQLAGYITAPPYELDVTAHIWNGENTVEVVVIGTLKNTLGPHHGKPALGSAWPGMFQKGPDPRPPGAEYDTVGYGLGQPFVLQQVLPQQ